MKKELFKSFKTTSIFLLILLGFWCFSQQETLVERFYSNKLFPAFAIIGQTLGAWIPFDLGDCFYGVCILFLLAAFIVLIFLAFKRKYRRAGKLLLHLVNAGLLIAIAFYLFWGLNYFRVPLERRIGLTTTVKEPCELLETTVLCIDKANAYRARLSKQDLQQSNQEIFDQAQDLLSNNTFLASYLFVFHPKVKEPLTNFHVNYTMVAGYFNPFTQEAQVNTAMPTLAKPFTACHELSHQAGIGFEDEANLIGFILCASSDNKLFNYSAYYHALFMLLNQVFLEDRQSYQNLLAQLSPAVRQDAEQENAYWQQFEGIVNHASSKFYNEYLQLNNQPEGLKRYNRMTKLLIAWLKDHPISEVR
ncbi:DUF3810 domain-containing protein [Olivibacter ginsenosidimutans]|uniref:DUF3810 domain-containing protein n=1 Tax=Olivibacter ginsenosidimutans TaxID=1176537 RepID=UPI0031E57015